MGRKADLFCEQRGLRTGCASELSQVPAQHLPALLGLKHISCSAFSWEVPWAGAGTFPCFLHLIEDIYGEKTPFGIPEDLKFSSF